MRILGKKSLSSVVKIFVDIAWYFSILVTVALFAAVVAVYFWNPKHVSQEIPIAFDLAPSSYHVSSDTWKLEEAEIVQATGKLRLVGLGLRETVLPTGLVFPALAIVLLVLNRLRAIFKTLRQGSPFVFENASRIRVIGLALISRGGIDEQGECDQRFVHDRGLLPLGLKLRCSIIRIYE
jgi:hypothetical protein